MVALEGVPYRIAEPRANKPVFESNHQLLGMKANLPNLSGELQAGGDSICLMFMLDWSVLITPQQAILDSLSTFSSYALHRPS